MHKFDFKALVMNLEILRINYVNQYSELKTLMTGPFSAKTKA